VSLLSSLLVLIVAARLLGRLFARYGQPELIGEILAGVLLGPAALNLIQPNAALAGISELAVFLIILSAGLEMRFADIIGAMRGRGLLLAAISFMVPFLGGVLVAAAYRQDVMRMIFLGLCISLTALPVAVKLLGSLGILHTRIARYALATAVVNDVAALFILGIVLNIPQHVTWGGAALSIAVAIVKLFGLGLLVLSLNQLLGWLDQRNLRMHAVPEALVRYFGPEALFGVVIIFVMVFGSFTEMLGFHFVIGAFFGALFLDKRHFLASRYDDLRGTLGSITNGFLAPVFFAYLGLEFQAGAFHDIGFPLVVILVSILTKLLAGWLGGKLVGMPTRESIGLGCVLNGRGVMELVVAGIAYQKGFIGPAMFSTLILMGIVTTFLTPLLFKRVYSPAQLAEYSREKPEV
jgi:Kef-type K+ transport system membrane component KefB